MSKNKDWQQEFDEIWGSYPKNQRDNAKGLDAVIKDFIASQIEKTRREAHEEGRKHEREVWNKHRTDCKTVPHDWFFWDKWIVCNKCKLMKSKNPNSISDLELYAPMDIRYRKNEMEK